MGAARVQQLQRIGLWCGQHLDGQGGKLLYQRLQRLGPGGGQQLGGNGQCQALFQPFVQGLGLPVQLLQLLGQQAGLRLQRTGGSGGHRLAPAPVKQLKIQLGFQLCDGHADG